MNGKDGLPFPSTFDAQIWADEWLKTLSEKPSVATDRETMVGWFSNAIMAGYDTAKRRENTAQMLMPAHEVEP